MPASQIERYSSEVQIHLIVGGQALRVAQIGPDRIILHDTIDASPSEATLVINVDGQVEHRTITLGNGLRHDCDVVSYF